MIENLTRHNPANSLNFNPFDRLNIPYRVLNEWFFKNFSQNGVKTGTVNAPSASSCHFHGLVEKTSDDFY